MCSQPMRELILINPRRSVSLEDIPKAAATLQQVAIADWPQIRSSRLRLCWLMAR